MWAPGSHTPSRSRSSFCKPLFVRPLEWRRPYVALAAVTLHTGRNLCFHNAETLKNLGQDFEQLPHSFNGLSETLVTKGSSKN